MRKILAIVLILVIFHLSCTKDVAKLQPPTIASPASITVGDHMNYTDLNPDLAIYDSIGFDGNGANRDIDINGDSVKDYRISTYYGAQCAGLSNWRNSRIATLNSDAYILTDSIYPDSNNVGSPSLVDSLYPKVLSLNDQVTISDRWSQGNFLFGIRVNDDCASNNYFQYIGYWVNLPVKYIGIKIGTRLGWIKILSSPAYNIVYEYGLSD